MPAGFSYRWTGVVSGNFADHANWIDASTGNQVGAPPGTSDQAELIAAGTLTGTGQVNLLSLNGTQSGLTLAGSLSAAQTTVAGHVTIGTAAALHGTGTLTTGVVVGQNGAAGTLSIAGAGALLDMGRSAMLVGAAGTTGSCSITAGGKLFRRRPAPMG